MSAGSRLDRLFAKYLPEVDRDDTKECWHWRGTPYFPKPYATKTPKGHRVVKRPCPQMKVRYGGVLTTPSKLLYSLFIGDLEPHDRLTSDCGCVNPWHQKLIRRTGSYKVPPYGDLVTFIRDVIQPDASFDFDTFHEAWAEELAHIPKDIIRAVINGYLQGQ